MNTIRCCISCILPCGAFDVIRIVHLDGQVDEFSKTIRAGEVMKANPNHVLRKSSSEDGVLPKIVVLPPEAELERGKIYFLTPIPSMPKKTPSLKRKKRREPERKSSNSNNNRKGSSVGMTKVVISDRYLSDILSEKITTQRDRRRGRIGIWRPHLESIDEISIEC